jgi:polysaccharide chain length determinant protein (PEP-CTERM system associated)
MINSQKAFNSYDYIDIFLKRIWYFIIPVVLVFTGTVVYLVITPKWFKSSSLILVSPQKIPQDYVKATVTSTVEDRLQSIAQEIMSRTRLEQVISEYKLYPNMVKSAPMEEVVEAMRRDIQIDVPTSRDKEKNHFTISYMGKDPRLVASVTAKLASLFIEENLKIREQQAQGTTEFLESELNAKKEKVEKIQAEISAFKRRYINELPENRDANLKVLEQLNLQSQKINETIKAAEDRKLIIQSQLANMPYMGGGLRNNNLGREEGVSPAAAAGNPTPPMVLQLSHLKTQLDDLQTKYTDNHPDIRATKRKIADLEKKIAESKAHPADSGKKGKDGDSLTDQYNYFQEERKTQLALLDKDIRRLQKEDEKVRATIAAYQGRIENTPIRELSLSTMIREFNSVNEAYQILLKKSTEAQQAENLERRQKGEQFRIIDPARVPEKPFKPDALKVLLIGLALSLGAGLGVTFIREQMDHSFRDAEDLETTLGLKVLANIPKIEKEAA